MEEIIYTNPTKAQIKSIFDEINKIKSTRLDFDKDISFTCRLGCFYLDEIDYIRLELDIDNMPFLVIKLKGMLSFSSHLFF